MLRIDCREQELKQKIQLGGSSNNQVSNDGNLDQVSLEVVTDPEFILQIEPRAFLSGLNGRE